MLKKKILVTGGAGFIGGNFVKYMVEKYPDYDIYNLDLLTYAGDLLRHRDIEQEKNYHFIKADIADSENMLKLFKKEKFDYVVHFAAESHVDRSITDPEPFVKTNILGTQVLLDVALKNGLTKFIHISTDEVYGDTELNSSMLFTEESKVNPTSPYSASKASSDLLVCAYHKTFGLSVNIIRSSNNYGPYQFPEKLIPLTISRLLNNQKVPVYGNGRNIRDWLYVSDFCDAIDLVLHKGVSGEIYNVGGKNERTNLEVVKTIINHLGKTDDFIEFVQDRPAHDKRYAIDSSKIRKLGWVPKYTFETGIEQTVQWYIDNKQWWQKIISGEYRNYFKKQYGMDYIW